MAFAQAANPAIGTWKLNVAKSKYTAGVAAKSAATKIEAAGAGVKTSVVSADGKMRTVTSKGTDAKGGAVDSVVIYDRQ